jgi:glycylpeptide N-tetradecanoyltransferase
MLPSNFEFVYLNLTDKKELYLLYDFLKNNYVEDSDEEFRLYYTKDFLEWALTPPNYSEKFHISVKDKKNNVLCGFISGIPFSINHNTNTKNIKENVCVINFLCIHKDYRGQNLCPKLFEYLFDQCKMHNIYKFFKTSEKSTLKYSKHFTTVQYYHKCLNIEKLIDIGFCDQSINKIKNKIKEKDIVGIQIMKQEHVVQVKNQLQCFLGKYKIYQDFIEKEQVIHWLLPKDDIIQTYVVEDPITNQVTDMISFYIISYNVLNSNKYKKLKIAHLYYYFNIKNNLVDLLQYAIIEAKKMDIDLFNALNIMDNEQIFEKLNFIPGTGFLNYYFINKDEFSLPTNNVGVILL